MIHPTNLIRQGYGNFDARFSIGPAEWRHYDLLWIHKGAVRLFIGKSNNQIRLEAPTGILICPNTSFIGEAEANGALASITHFETKGESGKLPGFLIAPALISFPLQAMVELSQRYARNEQDRQSRIRLLIAILDAFLPDQDAPHRTDRVDAAWERSTDRLQYVRSLSDVAAQIALSESAFRALHRREKGGSAGQHLQALRLSQAERFLSTTRMSVAQIANAVGYSHPESLIRAFQRTHSVSPGAYRRRADPFA